MFLRILRVVSSASKEYNLDFNFSLRMVLISGLDCNPVSCFRRLFCQTVFFGVFTWGVAPFWILTFYLLSPSNRCFDKEGTVLFSFPQCPGRPGECTLEVVLPPTRKTGAFFNSGILLFSDYLTMRKVCYIQ